MKKNLLFGILLFGILTVSAQTITIEKSYRLLDEGRTGFFPLFNTAGNFLIFTGDGYAGLNVFDFSNGTIIPVTDELSAGFNPVFTDDGRVFFRYTVHRDRLRFDGVRSFDLRTRTTLDVIEPQRNLMALQSVGNSVMVAVDDNRLLRATARRSSATTNKPYVWSNMQNLNIHHNGQSRRLNPVDGANGYIWVSLSPNGKMILFTAVGRGTYVSDLDGNIITSFDHLSAPVWFGNKFVVGMIDKDDGHVITGSSILMKSLDGRVSKTLSPPNQIAMYPAASGAANKVAYVTDNGIIYILELSIR